MSHLDPILVGVDGSRASSAAVRYAAHEAHRLGVDLHLVHVPPNYLPITPLHPLVPLDLEETGLDILGAAQVEAHRILALDRVKISLLGGSRILSLLDASAHASLVVLGTKQRSLVERVVTASTLFGVAAGATCPVVAVPADWSPHDARHRVAAGVKSPAHSQELLRRAFEVATDHKATLVLVHAWRLPGQYDDLISTHVDEDEWADRAVDVIEESLVGLREIFPHVPVEIRVVHAQAAVALRTVSAETDVVLVARRHRGFPLGHLGGTARALLRVSECPIEVVPPADEPIDTAGLVLEEAGRLQR